MTIPAIILLILVGLLLLSTAHRLWKGDGGQDSHTTHSANDDRQEEWAHQERLADMRAIRELYGQ